MRTNSRLVSGVLTLCLGSGLLSCGHKEETKPPAPATPPASAAHDATFSDKGVTIDGKLIPLPCTEKDITAVLGAPSRKEVMQGTYTIFVWDDKGIIAYF